MSEKQSKRARFLAPTPQTTAIEKTLQSMHEPEAVFMEVPLDRIDPDPDNPRELGLDASDPRNIAEDDPERAEKQAALEQLEELAQSIRSVGVMTPISVYRVGNRFRILAGERRYLASRLASKPTIPAIILEEKPKDATLKQYIENANRAGLPLRKRLRNIERIIATFAGGESVNTPERLSQIAGIGRAQAFRIVAVVNAQKDVRDAIDAGKLTSLAHAAEISGMASPEDRRAAINGTAPPVRTAAGKPTKPRSRGRPSVVSLGTVKNTTIIRRLVEAVAGEKRFAATDWTNTKDTAKVFRQVVALMEKGEL